MGKWHLRRVYKVSKIFLKDIKYFVVQVYFFAIFVEF